MFATLRSLFDEKVLHESFLGIADENDEGGKSHRHVVANLRPMWNAECDRRLRGRASLSDVRVASAPSRDDDDDDDDDALDHLTVVECVARCLVCLEGVVG